MYIYEIRTSTILTLRRITAVFYIIYIIKLLYIIHTCTAVCKTSYPFIFKKNIFLFTFVCTRNYYFFNSTLEYQNTYVGMNQVQHLPLLVSDLKSKTFSDSHMPRRTKPPVHGFFNKSTGSL